MTEHERIERRPSTAPSLEHRPTSLCKASLVLKIGVNEDPVWVNRQTLTGQRGEENRAVSLQGASSAIICDSMNQLLHIINLVGGGVEGGVHTSII